MRERSSFARAHGWIRTAAEWVLARLLALAGRITLLLPHAWQRRVWDAYNRYWLYPRSGLNQTPFVLPMRPEKHLDLASVLQGHTWHGQRPDVIILSIIDWAERFQRPQHLALAFAQAGHRVFYVERPQGPSAENHASSSVRQVAPGLFCLRLKPIPKIDFYEQRFSASLVDEIIGTIDQLRISFGIKSPIIKVDFPTWAPLAIELQHRYTWKLLYDCMEDHDDVQWGRPDLWHLDEQILFSRSDVVIAASAALADKARQAGGASQVLEVLNGLAMRHFQRPGPVPLSHLTRLPHPVLGYFGIIADWFDVDMILEAARLRPQWTWLLIGNVVGISSDLFAGLGNILLLGEQPYHHLPAFAQLFDLCLIPHRVRDRTNRSGSLKYFEYLALGKPVIAAPLAWLEPYRELGLVHFARNGEELVAQAELAMQTDSPQRSAERRRFVEQFTWDRQVEKLWPALRACYAKVSVIVVTYNNRAYTQDCLQSILDKTRYPHYEVIIVDNGSVDDTVAYLSELCKEQPHFKFIVNGQNLGFARANNIGIAASSGQYLILLNNDTIVTQGWIEGLIAHLRAEGVGAVGPVTNMAGNDLRIPVDYPMLELMDAFAIRYATKHAGETFEVRMLPMFCMAMRRAVYDEIGPLDERFGVGMFEDDDYARRLRLAGYAILGVRDVFIHHIGNASFGQLGNDAYQRIFERNRALYEEKWGTPWEPPDGWQA